MVLEDQDISGELDRVVCRLTKMALTTVRWRQRPLSLRWMQWKLLDLLKLTENAIEKKRLHDIQSRDMKAICYEQQYPNIESEFMNKIKEDCFANEIVNKYRCFAHSSEKTSDINDLDIEDDLLSKEFFNISVSKFDEPIGSPSLIDIEHRTVLPKFTTKMFYDDNKTSLSRTRVWVDEDIDTEYSNDGIGSVTGEIDHINRNIVYYENKKLNGNTKDVKYDKPEIPHCKIRRGKTDQEANKRRGCENCNINRRRTVSTNKNTKKKSCYNILTKICSKNKSKISFRNASKNIRRQLSNVSRTRPIPNTLVTSEKNVNLTRNSEEVNDCIIPDADCHSLHIRNLETNIAATKESLVIDIITEDNEETIALRRTIGTDADDDQILERETALGSLTNVMKIDSFGDKNSMESVYHCQPAIFLFDINEPSTSKGVRHVSMDVQCGTENVFTEYPILTPATSLTKTNSIFNTRIIVEDSKINLAATPISNDFATSTEGDLYPIAFTKPKIKTMGIIIKDSDTSFTEKIENSSLTHKTDSMHTASPAPNICNSTTCTSLLKNVSSRLKMYESCSENCDSVRSSQKSPINLKTNLKSHNQSKSSVTKDITGDIISCSNYCTQKLCCGGVYVHSYKDRQVIEDVVYQGEWQKYTTDSASKRNLANEKYKLNPKENIIKKNQSKLINRLPIHSKNLKGMNGDSNNRYNKKYISVPNNVAEGTKRKETKVKAPVLPSKLAVKSAKSNIVKLSYVTQKSSLKCNFVRKETDNPQRCKRKDYIPLYLKRKLVNNKDAAARFKNNLEKSMEGSNELKNGLLINLKVNNAPTKKKSLNIDFKQSNNISYLIYHNEIDVTKNRTSDCVSPTLINMDRKTDIIKSSPSCQSIKTGEINKPSRSSQSIISSMESSSNSISTVRARTALNVSSDRKHLPSSNRSNLDYSQSKSGSSKQYCKTYKMAKRPEGKVLDIKETVSVSSMKSKNGEASVIPKFLKNKNNYKSHISNENNPTVSNITSSDTPALNKVNNKVLPIPSFSEKHINNLVPSKLSVSKKSPAKLIFSSNNKIERDTKEAISMKTSEVKKVMFDSELKKESIINIIENNLLNKWMNTKCNSNTEKGELNAIRDLIEEQLDFVIQLSDVDQEVDSKTVILGEDTLHIIPGSSVSSFNDVTSCNSNCFGAIDNYEFDNPETKDNIFFNSAVYNDPICGTDSVIKSFDNKPTVADTELVLFKSLTSISKLSEYFLAESSLNNTSNTHTAIDSDIPDKTVRDIFERRNQPSTQVPASSVAMQAFSGFSMNSAPVTGARPDPKTLIDSATSLVVDVRLATSEELLVSTRSSGSYESCLVDDDTVVPNWLFQIISHQQSVDGEEESDSEIEDPLPVMGPALDANLVEPGAGAGAGDGRGIHSDISEDTSGRGSSISSSDTSSGHQSVAILIEPIAFTSQYDRTREPISSSSTVPFLIITTESPDTSRAVAVGVDNTRNLDALNSSGDPQVIPLALQATSDMDADVSSIDTDAPDSDN